MIDIATIIPNFNIADLILGLVTGWLMLEQPDFAAQMRGVVMQKVIAMLTGKSDPTPPAGK